MKYNCALCKYSTDNNSNYNHHLKSKKHCKNEIVNNIDNGKNINNNLNKKKKEIKVYNCNICNNKFKHHSSYYRHFVKCKETENNIIKNNIIKDNNNIKVIISEIVNKNFSEEIKDIKQSMNILANNNDKLTDVVIDDHQYIKTVAIEAKKFAEETLSTVNYIIKYYDNAPVIEKNINYHQKLQYDAYNKDNIKDDEKIVEDLLSYQRHKTLIKYLGDIIIETYKKKDPEKQSIWNSDVSRRNYLLRELVGKTASWITDKKGIKVTEIVIDPFIDKIRELLVKYLKTPFLNPEHRILEKQAELRYFNNDLIMDIVKDIDDNKLHTEINKYIAPYFFFDKNNYIKESKLVPKKIATNNKTN